MGGDSMGGDAMGSGAMGGDMMGDDVMMEDSSCPSKVMDGPYSYDPTSMTGPMSWGFLKPEYARCTTGMEQSPIDFPTSVKFDLAMNAPRINLMKANMTLKPLPFNWELQCAQSQMCGSTMFNGTTYYVTKLRFTRPSEHTLNGTRYPFEAMIEHRSMTSNRTIALVRLFNVKKESGYFYKIAKMAMFDVAMNDVVGSLLMQAKKMNSSKDTVMADLPGIMKPDSGFCSYMGSQTIPPCTEGVKYFLSMDIGVISRKQLHHFWAVTGFSFDGNNRPTKPINGRKVTCYIKPDMMDKLEQKMKNMSMTNPNMTMDGTDMMNGGNMSDADGDVMAPNDGDEVFTI